jgi:serine/threonine protein kinase
MAPETIFAKQFSPASDVWAYGVVLFEIFSRGEEPYCAFTALEVLNRHRRNQGIVMDCPQHCPHDIYAADARMLATPPDGASDFPAAAQACGRPVGIVRRQLFRLARPDGTSSSKLWAAARRRHNNRHVVVAARRAPLAPELERAMASRCRYRSRLLSDATASAVAAVALCR